MIIAIGVVLGLIAILVDVKVRRASITRPAIGAWWYGFWMVTCVALSAVNFADGNYGWGAWMAVCAVVDGIHWWRNNKRRKRKRTMALLGEKSRAAIAKLVTRQREAMVPTR